MEQILRLVAIIFLSYLIGSIPTALIISKKVFGFDIREKGSGNVGSTNAIRILGWKWGLIVQIIDILKGVLAVLIFANLLGGNIKLGSGEYFEHITIVRIIAGLSAVTGHIWSIFAGFRGGKGINTTAGILVGIAPLEIGIALGIFIIAVMLSGYISLGSILGALALPSTVIFRYNLLGEQVPAYHIIFYFTLSLAVLLLFTHRKNIIRILKGTENRFSKLQIIKIKPKNTSN